MTDGRRVWTDEELAFLREYAPGHSRREIYEELSRRFPRHTHTFENMVACMKNHGITNGLDGRFQKGRKSEAWNKGKKMTPEHRAKCEHSFFGSKNKPPKTEPVGTEKKLSDGYILVKVDDQINAKKNINWKQKHRLIWEQEHGPVPEGMLVTFLDGDRENFSLDNLALITKAEHARLNQSGLRSKDPELTTTALQVAKLTTKIGQLQRDIKEKKR